MIIKNMGVVKFIVNIEVMMVKNVCRNDDMFLGIILLMLLMFLEKWFMIFFCGVVLKNDIGECRMLFSIF